MTRSPLAAAFALLGVAAAAAAGVWYATLKPRTPSAELTLPRVIGVPQRAAVRELTRDGLRVRVVEPKGLGGGGVVIGETPLPETTVARGSTVTLRVAKRYACCSKRRSAGSDFRPPSSSAATTIASTPTTPATAKASFVPPVSQSQPARIPARAPVPLNA